MTTLLRKDAVWLLMLGLAGLVAGLVVMADAGAGLWYRPDIRSGEASLVFYWIAAGVLGLVAGLFEDATFTREYLLHRPVSHARLFWIRQLGSGLVLATWILVMPALHLLATRLFHPSASLVEPGRWWTLVHQGSVGVAFYAVALFAATVVRRWWLAVLLAAALSLALLLFFALGAYEGARPVLYRLLVPTSFAVALPLLLVSLRISREGRDLDRPVSRARLVATGVGLTIFSLAGSIFLHILQLDLRRDIHALYPKIARLPDGSPVLLGEKPYRAPWRMDQNHQRIEGSVEKAEVVFETRGVFPVHRDPEHGFGQRGRLSHGLRYERVLCSVPAFCYIGSDGQLHLFAYDAEEGPVTVRHVAKDDGRRFSSRSQVMGYWGRVALIGDPEDGGVWRYDLLEGGGGFSRLPLPGGDRFVENLSPFLPRANPNLWGSEPLVVQGERGLYVVAHDAVEKAPPEIQEAAGRLERRRTRMPAQVQHLGPVHFRVAVPAGAEGPAFNHDYAPRTFFERGLDLQMQALSLLRAPLMSSLSLLARPHTGLGNPTDDDARILLDPLVMLGSRFPLVLTLVLGAGLAALTFRRLGRLQVPTARRAGWTGVVLATGVLGYVVCRACENRRAWHVQEVTEAKARPPLLIQSAAA